MRLPALFFAFLALSANAVLAQPHPDATAPGTLLGKIEEGRYTPASGAYSVAIPILQGDNALVMDNPDIVVFKDDESTLVTIAAFKMPPLQKWELETTDTRQFLVKFFRDYIMQDYAEAFPDTTVERAVFVPELESGALLVQTLHPGGSAFKIDPIVSSLPDTPKPVAKRGNLLFCRDECVFVIATEIAERVTQFSTYVTDDEAEEKLLRVRLFDIHSQIEFKPTAAK